MDRRKKCRRTGRVAGCSGKKCGLALVFGRGARLLLGVVRFSGVTAMPATELSIICPSCETPFVAVVVLPNGIGHTPPARPVHLICLQPTCRHQFGVALDADGRLASGRPSTSSQDHDGEVEPPVVPAPAERRPVPAAGRRDR